MTFFKWIFLSLFFISTLAVAIVIDPGPKPTQEIQLPDFRSFDTVREKKREFFEFMRPIIKQENARILEKRKNMLRLYEKWNRDEPLTDEEWETIKELCREYEINWHSIDQQEMWELLKLRVDIIPMELALVQAAKESAWGTSRFATLGNAMFGQWTYSQENEGIIPRKRRSGERHSVARFKSVRHSVRSYLHNLNTHYAYKPLRRLRLDLRKSGQDLDSYRLALGLLKYSERRMDYVSEIRELIIHNRHLMGSTQS